jgi:hypothetical protein
MAKLIMDPTSGTKHLPGSSLCMHVTLCGHVDSFEDGEGIESDGTPDCTGCIDVAREVFAAITKKELKLLP